MASSHANQHDYHLLDPSPWPILASLSAFVTAIGAIIWMRSTGGQTGLFGVQGPGVFAAGILGLTTVAFMWWRDVVIEAETGQHTPVVQIHQRYGMLLFIASEVIFSWPGSGPTSISRCSPTARIRMRTFSKPSAS